jgi:beta-galactosidase
VRLSVIRVDVGRPRRIRRCSDDRDSGSRGKNPGRSVYAPNLAWVVLKIVAWGLLLVVSSAASAVAAADQAAPAPRERILINDGWRFRHGDPEGVDSSKLLYDALPAVNDTADDKPADAKPKEAEQATTAPTQMVLKPWILPTGNRFIKDPAKRHAWPAQEPSLNVPSVLPSFDDTAWQPVDLPQDWASEGPFNKGGSGVGGGMGRLPTPGVGWYRRKFDMPAGDPGRSIFLDVDGAMAYATVWLNGHLVGGWPYGYSSWRVDLTPHIIFGGVNQLAIRLNDLPDSSRWYPGAGIYRDVWLTKVRAIHVAQWGTRVMTPQASTASATIDLAVTVDNDSDAAATVAVDTAIYPSDADGRAVGDPLAQISSTESELPARGTAVVTGSTTLGNPRLWGPPPTQRPNRYLAVTTIWQQGKEVDRYETRFGIRSVTFDPEQGLLINGQRVAIQGVNQHHDLGALGAAFNTRAAQRQLEELAEMGCNAIRMSHNPPAPQLLELTDRMGFLVIDEIFDCWYRRKAPYDFHLVFPDWHEQDLRSMIRRDGNCPSVILWSVGNEVGEQYTGQAGASVAEMLRDIAHNEDPTRPVMASMNFAKPDMPFAAVWDVLGLNYQGEGIRDTPEFAGTKGIHTPPQYDAFHQKFPDKLILSSETASTLSTRGTYLFPLTSKASAPVREGAGGDSKKRYVSAYELYAIDFGASPDKVFGALDAHRFVAGEFVWSGWDYLGEPSPYYSTRSSYCGIIDLAGFKKDRFYLYQSHWRPDLPMAHILPHWTWPERVGQVTPVHVFTSGDEAELFLNGSSVGRKRKASGEYRLRWDDLRYEQGELRVVTYKNGHAWATDVVKTAGSPAKLKLSADRISIAADGADLAFVTVRVTDQKGNTAPRADNRIQFTVEGPGEIVATENGDPTSLEPFDSPERNAFNGLALAIIRGKRGAAGTITVSAKSDSLRDAELTLQSVAGGK